MSNIDKQAVTAKTKELASFMVERFSMNPVSCKLLNEAWEKEFPDEVAIAERMLALLDELEHYKSREERVTKLVLDNSTSWDALYKKLEAAEKRIAEQREYYDGVIADGSKRIAELEHSETQLINERDSAESALADTYRNRNKKSQKQPGRNTSSRAAMKVYQTRFTTPPTGSAQLR